MTKNLVQEGYSIRPAWKERWTYDGGIGGVASLPEGEVNNFFLIDYSSVKFGRTLVQRVSFGIEEY